jgi:hypothetical protein
MKARAPQAVRGISSGGLTGEPKGVSKVLISDYRSVDHVRFSFAAEMTANKIVWRRKLADVKFNVPVDEELFRKTYR